MIYDGDRVIFSKNISELIRFMFKKNMNPILGQISVIPDEIRNESNRWDYAKRRIEYKVEIDIYLFDEDGYLLTDVRLYGIFGKKWQKYDVFNFWGGTKDIKDYNKFYKQLP